MYQGKYAKQNHKISTDTAKLRLRKLAVPAILAALLLLAVALTSVMNRRANRVLEGSWLYEKESAVFTFDGIGAGSFSQPDLGELTFRYQVRGQSLFLHYDRSDVENGEYTFLLNGTRLDLTAGEGTNGGVFALTKMNQ